MITSSLFSYEFWEISTKPRGGILIRYHEVWEANYTDKKPCCKTILKKSRKT